MENEKEAGSIDKAEELLSDEELDDEFEGGVMESEKSAEDEEDDEFDKEEELITPAGLLGCIMKYAALGALIWIAGICAIAVIVLLIQKALS